MVDAELVLAGSINASNVLVGQDLAQAAGTYLSTNGYDLGAAGVPALGGTVIKDVARGQLPRIHMLVTEAFTSGGAATVQPRLVQADNTLFTVNKEVLITGLAYPVATLIAGYRIRFPEMPPGLVTRRYLGFDFVIAVAATTAGEILAMLRETTPTNHPISA